MGQPFYETFETRTSASFGAALRSLKRHKRTPEYRAQLELAIKKAVLQEIEATASQEQLKARLTALECRIEMDCLERGEPPDPFGGWCKFPMPDEA